MVPGSNFAAREREQPKITNKSARLLTALANGRIEEWEPGRCVLLSPTTNQLLIPKHLSTSIVSC